MYSYGNSDDTETESSDEVDPEDSRDLATIVKWKLDELRRSDGLVGFDFIDPAMELLSKYAERLTDEDLAALARECGVDTDGNSRYF